MQPCAGGCLVDYMGEPNGEANRWEEEGAPFIFHCFQFRRSQNKVPSKALMHVAAQIAVHLIRF